MIKREGIPGMGKSAVLRYLGKPKWMPKWLWRWHTRHKVVDIKLAKWED